MDASEREQAQSDPHLGPTSRDGEGRLVVRSHAAVVAAAHDPESFSNAVSAHLQVPNGLDGDAHAEARRLLDPFFEADELAWLEPVLGREADALLTELVASEAPIDAVGELGARYAVRGQSVWLGWSPAIESELLQWVVDHRSAARAGDVTRLSAGAAWFDAIVSGELDRRHRDDSIADVTRRLMQLRDADGRPLGDEVIVSVLRNWTGGDLSSIALCAGVVAHALATRPELQQRLVVAGDAELDAVVDEILRLDDPFVSNRRRATRDAVVDGCPVAAGDVLVLDWRAANRDPSVFGDGFDPHAPVHARANLVYGTGPHVCPGRPLASLELRVLVRRLLAFGGVVLAGEPQREEPPVAGFRSVPVRVGGVVGGR